jgi:hypothetical protein
MKKSIEMKRVIFFTLFFSLAASILAQTSVVYKKNSATGELEVYESRGGLPTGNPLFKVKKNVYGYIEVQNSGVNQDPFTKKPDYSNYNNFKPYQLPAKEIFETLETINKRYEYDNLASDAATNSNSSLLEKLNNYTLTREATAKAFLKFYNSNVAFPKTLKDGWYEVVKIFESKGFAQAGIIGGTDFKYGICHVLNNKVNEYYENSNILDLKGSFVFQKMAIDVSSPVGACKFSFRVKNSNEYETVYFLDSILDETKQITDPQFSFFSIFTESALITPKDVLAVQISRNTVITRDKMLKMEAGPYVAMIIGPNIETTDCANSLMTLAFRKNIDNFSIGVVNFVNNKVWIFNNLIFSPGQCRSSTLTQ